MDFASLLKGAAVGFAIAAPVGPIGLLCIRRTFSDGAMTGLATGLGAAAADATYGLVAALGLGALTALLLNYASWLQVGGAVLMAALGIASLRRAARPAAALAAAAKGSTGLLSAFASTFMLTLTNPMTILSFAGMLAALSPSGTGVWGGAALVAGVFAGSVAWWLLLVGGVSASRKALPPQAMRWIEGSSGLALLGFAAWSLHTAA
ncbi:LysE family translocator [Massilia endophytica]|uniref:LysE family translocator n=1 Tax=Massilia endophytica TaxID=2899220 RepID=UPI001E3940B4|nr:LysE family transporter [Massilia endophytica]UGQ48329.1 LysE family transporter [Massilia endophytica]